jgi:hypothetical protein
MPSCAQATDVRLVAASAAARSVLLFIGSPPKTRPLHGPNRRIRRNAVTFARINSVVKKIIALDPRNAFYVGVGERGEAAMRARIGPMPDDYLREAKKL